MNKMCYTCVKRFICDNIGCKNADPEKMKCFCNDQTTYTHRKDKGKDYAKRD